MGVMLPVSADIPDIDVVFDRSLDWLWPQPQPNDLRPTARGARDPRHGGSASSRDLSVRAGAEASSRRLWRRRSSRPATGTTC